MQMQTQILVHEVVSRISLHWPYTTLAAIIYI